MELDWTPLALDDRIEAFQHIALESVRSAVKVDDAIEGFVDQLIDFPEMGRAGRCAGTRELVITGYPFTAVYHIYGNTVRILRVLHHAQNWPRHISF